jgi:TonB family protein
MCIGGQTVENSLCPLWFSPAVCAYRDMTAHHTTHGTRAFTSTKLLLLAGLLAACVASTATAAPPKIRHTSVEGSLDKAAIREVVKARIHEVRECYNAELSEDETVAGRSVVSFVVQPDGSVTEVGVPESTMPERFDACMVTAVEGWSFPASAGQTRVMYPFEMSAG